MSGVSLDFAPMIPWLSFAGLLLTVGGGFWALASAGTKRNGERISQVSRQVESLDRRVSTVEQTVTGLPGKDDIHDLRIALAGIRGDLKAIETAQNAVAESSQRNEAVTRRLEQYLLDRSGKS